MDKNEIKLLTEIRDLLIKSNNREEAEGLLKDTNYKKVMDQVEKRSYDSLLKIRSNFDRIHDKLFNLNTLLIGAFLGLSKFPESSPIFNLYHVLFPVFNLFFLVFLEKSQMEIYRHESLETEWTESDRRKYKKDISNQNLLSLTAIITTAILLFHYFYCYILKNLYNILPKTSSILTTSANSSAKVIW